MSSFIIKERRFYSSFFYLVLPILAQNLLSVSIGLADNIMVGRLGDLAISSVFMANQVSNLLHMLMTGMSSALLILGSHYAGGQDTQGVRLAAAVSLRYAMLVSFIIMIVTILFPDQTLSIFTDKLDVIHEGRAYLQIIALSFPLFILQGLLLSALRSVEQVKIGTTVTFIAFVTNVGLNALLIFGLLGFPAMGVRGAALASLISRIISFTVLLIYTFRIDQRLKFKPKDLFLKDPDITRRYFRYGLPVIIGDLTWGINMLTQSAIIGRLGSVAITAISISNTIFNIVAVINYSIRDAASLRIGQAVARDPLSRIKQLTRTFQIIFISFGLLSGLTMFLARPLFLSFYPSISSAAYQESMLYLAILSVTLVGTSYQVGCLTGIVRAGGATSFVLINDLLWIWLFVIPSAAICAFVLHTPAYIVFIFLKSDQILKCIVAFIKVNRYRWIRDLSGRRQSIHDEEVLEA